MSGSEPVPPPRVSDAGRAERVRRALVVTGVVQGVGMRPFLVRTARELGLAGRCANTSTAVHVEVEGDPEAVLEFVRRVRGRPPPLARVASVTEREVAPQGESSFVVVDSVARPGVRTLVAPDTAPCEACLRELADPADRRYRHPFITCTDCGPRYTITLDLPYDRPLTTMAGFPMCPACAAEYADPADRRYHAQPIGCHDCGPVLSLTDAAGSVLGTREEALSAAQGALRDGAVLAVKGLGGYHLACRADRGETVDLLRRRKHRPHQPFAVMVADLDVARRVAAPSPGAVALLTSAARPIVLVPRAPGPRSLVVDEVAPALDELGLLLPYTPLHHLLLDPAAGLPALVMTSGNRSGEPLCVADDDARRRLGVLADAFLVHDRPIAVPCEDSVVTVDADDRPVPVRRSRGHAPLPVELAGPAGAVVLAAGAELKNTFTLVRDGLAFVSAHVGDLGTLESRAAYETAVAQAERFHAATPTLVAADLHPGYASRAWAFARSSELGVTLVDVQHHHAHLAALAAERGLLEQPLVGLVFDGTGYGCDGTVWGGELLALRDGGGEADRIGHLGVLPLPGGDAGVRHPVRTAAAALLASGADPARLLPGTPLGDALTDAERRLLPHLLAGRTGWVATSSVGRLFDIASSLLGVRHRVSYEAQAAIELEALAARWAARHGSLPPATTPPYAAAPRTTGAAAGAAADEAATRILCPPPVTRVGQAHVLDPRPLVLALDDAVRRGEDRGRLAWEVHAVLADGAAQLAGRALEERGTDVVGLTGGVFQNRLLTALVSRQLHRAGARVLVHRVVPPNDGGLSLGQAAVALARARTQPGAGGGDAG